MDGYTFMTVCSLCTLVESLNSFQSPTTLDVLRMLYGELTK